MGSSNDQDTSIQKLQASLSYSKTPVS